MHTHTHTHTQTHTHTHTHTHMHTQQRTGWESVRAAQHSIEVRYTCTHTHTHTHTQTYIHMHTHSNAPAGRGCVQPSTALRCGTHAALDCGMPPGDFAALQEVVPLR